ncbi:hypothetical protein PDJAM_G00101010 [Pangasius djambal]|uniref:Uncharacterized protein n=1 Tax=Pangasius djambal TaxID=1691987 RepID=A0ACC5Z9K5_9TELE|nr:hypothetical protein [Pangasius djambal]
MSDNDDIEVDSDADKRAHHNALERKRRDHIKDSFHSLRDSVPALQGEKVSTLRALEKVKGNTQLQGGYSSSDSSLYTNPKGSAVSAFDGGSDSSSESEPEETSTRKKVRQEAS